MAPPLTGKSLILHPPTEGEGSIKRILCSLLVAALPFGSVPTDAPKSKNAKVTLVYQGARGHLDDLLTAGPVARTEPYFLPVKNSLMFSPLNLAPSTTVWPMPANISLNPRPT